MTGAAGSSALPAPARAGAPVLGPAAALLRANIRYWSSLAPLVRHELRQWTARAERIPDRSVRELACEKLRTEHFNAEVAATLATLSPEEHRQRVVEAIVAFEVLYDYLDGLTERAASGEPAGPEGPGVGSVERGERLYRPFTTVFAPGWDAADRTERSAGGGLALDDGGYAEELAAAVREAIAGLPSLPAVARMAERAARRCAEAQVRVHASPVLGSGELERWARDRAAQEDGLEWRAYVAGSVASVLCVHALIAAAAAPSLEEAEAGAIDRAYLHVSALSTMLDSLVDYERDVRCGEPWLARLHGGPAPLGRRLGPIARDAMALARRTPDPAHHTMTLLGVVAYYTSAPEGKAEHELTRAPFARLHRELGPVVVPTLAVMRTWRLAKRLRRSPIVRRRGRRGVPARR